MPAPPLVWGTLRTRRVVFNSYRGGGLEITVVDCIFWYKGRDNEVVRRRGNYIVVS